MTYAKNFAPPALPLPSQVYVQQDQSRLNNVLRLYFNQLDNLLQDLTTAVSTAESITEVSGNYTATESDSTILCDASAAPITITLPVVEAGKVYTIKKIDSSDNAIVITPTTLLDGAASQTTVVQYVALKVQSDGTDWWII